MKIIYVLATAAALATLSSYDANAEGGVPGGISHGFYEGNRIAGPVGAVVGGAVGGVVGGVEGVLGVNHVYARPEYEELRPQPTRRYYPKHARHKHRHYSAR